MAKTGKKGSLKAALSSQQDRLRKKQQAEQAHKAAEQKTKSTNQSASNTKGKAKDAEHRRPIIIPFKTTDKILLVGEGNFSFARALVVDPPLSAESSSTSLAYLPPSSITATAHDSEEACYSKYPDAEVIVAGLRDKGVQILFGVDATKLEKCPPLKGRQWDKIVWNFPHAGKGITDQDRNILSNQLLILGFLRSAATFLRAGPAPYVHPTKKKKHMGDEDDEDEPMDEDLPQDTAFRGTILITLRNVTPYTLWDVPKLAKKPPPSTTPGQPHRRYVQLRSFAFHRATWKGYEHRMTKGERAYGTGTTGEGGEDRTWEFYLAD